MDGVEDNDGDDDDDGVKHTEASVKYRHEIIRIVRRETVTIFLLLKSQSVVGRCKNQSNFQNIAFESSGIVSIYLRFELQQSPPILQSKGTKAYV